MRHLWKLNSSTFIHLCFILPATFKFVLVIFYYFLQILSFKFVKVKTQNIFMLFNMRNIKKNVLGKILDHRKVKWS